MSTSPQEPAKRGVVVGGNAPAGLVETHTSVLFFVGDLVYKLKKAVDFGFLDFRERATRRAACQAEVELNQRLAPDVYLGVADILGPGGEPWDSLVVMRRMSADRRLSTLVTNFPDSAGATAGLRSLGRLIASFHAKCATSPAIAAAAEPAALRGLWRDNLEVLHDYTGSVLDAAQVAAIDRLALAYLAGREPLLRLRQRLGLVRDGHGDLLADDIFMLEDGPRVLDCLEFDARLRHGDVLNDVAFLAMDLEHIGAAAAARAFLAAYAEFSGERHPGSLEDFYIAYRAGVRAKVACLRWAQGEESAAPIARSFAALALRHLKRARVRLVLVGGLPGTGKSTVASAICAGDDQVDWTLLRSDVVRKELAQLPADQPAAAAYGAGLYHPEQRRRTYAELFRRARQALVLGESVVIDASFTGADERDAARVLAEETTSMLIEIECHAPVDVVAGRLSYRASQGTDASDADLQIALAMGADGDPWPSATRVDTSPAIPIVVRAAQSAIDADLR